MKQLLSISLILFSTALCAQTNNTNPAIPITPSITTRVTTQPASMPGSNTNPTTGTVISLNKKPAAKTPKPGNEIDTLNRKGYQGSDTNAKKKKVTAKKKN